MLERFAKFDLWVLDEIITPISWRIEWLTNLTCFQQARYLMAVHIAARYLEYFTIKNDTFLLAWAFLGLPMLYLASVYAEKEASSLGTASHWRYSHTVRAIWWFVGLCGVAHNFGLCDSISAVLCSSGDFSVLLFVYLLGCAPPPPKPKSILAPIPAGA